MEDDSGEDGRHIFIVTRGSIDERGCAAYRSLLCTTSVAVSEAPKVGFVRECALFFIGCVRRLNVGSSVEGDGEREGVYRPIKVLHYQGGVRHHPCSHSCCSSLAGAASPKRAGAGFLSPSAKIPTTIDHLIHEKIQRRRNMRQWFHHLTTLHFAVDFEEICPTSYDCWRFYVLKRADQYNITIRWSSTKTFDAVMASICKGGRRSFPKTMMWPTSVPTTSEPTYSSRRSCAHLRSSRTRRKPVIGCL